jgi:uncharacterized protein (DUF433 family)
MTNSVPPDIDDEEAYLHIDHRDEDEGIVLGISERLAEDDAIVPGDLVEGGMSVVYRGTNHIVPIAYSPHDRYITISSVAEILRERYSFFVHTPSLASDTHALLIADRAEAVGWRALPSHLAPLDLGFDYFGGIRVPYLGHTDAAPDFETDKASAVAKRQAGASFMESMLTGKPLSPEALANMAEVAAMDPRIAADFPGLSREQLTAQIAKEMQQAQGMPEVKDLQSHIASIPEQIGRVMRQGMAKKDKKPWWKFW